MTTRPTTTELQLSVSITCAAHWACAVEVQVAAVISAANTPRCMEFSSGTACPEDPPVAKR